MRVPHRGQMPVQLTPGDGVSALVRFASVFLIKKDCVNHYDRALSSMFTQ